MSLAFKLDNTTTALAREGSGRTGGRIDTTGGYVGEIEFIREIGKPEGAKGVEVSFVSDDGQTARFSLYTENAAGEPLAGLKKLYALMACAKVKDLKPMPGKVKIWDGNAKAMTEADAQIYPAMAKKRIGMILQKRHEVYEGKPKWKMDLFAPFTADTNQTAAEVLDNRGEKTQVEKMLATVKDWHKDGSVAVTSHSGAHNSDQIPVDAYEDVPFF